MTPETVQNGVNICLSGDREEVLSPMDNFIISLVNDCEQPLKLPQTKSGS